MALRQRETVAQMAARWLARYPIELSICSSIRRFISTAYSIGSCLMIGSMKPLTISFDASDSSEIPAHQVEELVVTDLRDGRLVTDVDVGSLRSRMVG